MAIITDDQSVSATTKWVRVQDGNAPFSVQVHTIVPAAVTTDYSLQGVNQLNDPNTSAPNLEDVITYSDMENETATKVTNIISPIRWIRILIDSLSGGVLRIKISQAGTVLFDDNNIG